MHPLLIPTATSFITAVVWLRTCDALAAGGVLTPQLSRKVIHMGTGPIFLSTWLLYPATPHARYAAALVPLAITLQFACVGLGVLRDDAAVKAMSRTGQREELLRGPLLYGAVCVIATIWGWRTSPAAIIALMCLCGGDGLADVIGRRWGARFPLPWSRGKSMHGSAAMLAGSALFSIAVLSLFAHHAHVSSPRPFEVLLVCALATAVESLPLRDVDNVTVAAAAAGAAVALGWS